jgi:hypothetical protein
MFGHGLRNPIWARFEKFEKSDFSKKSDFFVRGFLGMFGHGLRNPIWARFEKFEKSDFSKKSDLLAPWHTQGVIS